MNTGQHLARQLRQQGLERTPAQAEQMRERACQLLRHLALRQGVTLPVEDQELLALLRLCRPHHRPHHRSDGV
jgi:hypothetical protein